ncbi:hypothetical protein KHS38_00040 [Mucilaginibacter sp. Bleaf8]|uniref:hypothetical protein n=1 Tax=Mucilaginibacter sp. Bleaf8 TaxID=2834430 RepID=UPI001BCEC0D5|nr:hypothetical protein [Mucilaginibacter sp. Bleaf8]MBS7562780.1 hypothetical protein [Mucilaginibacter sp. Bleaf8]
MKNKASVYFLGLIVAVVWGLIIYRIVAAVNNDDELPVMPKTSANYPKEPLNDYEAIKDTVSLKLNYRDPFAMAKAPIKKDTAQIPVRQIISSTTRLSPLIHQASGTRKQAMNWGFIRYSGYIRNPHTKKLYALMTVSGKSLMLSEGESSGGVKLLKNLKDSIQISYQHLTHYIPTSNETP